ncbi:MAG: hypothetical protein DMG88_10055 [Acidobacteria bacterium]|nr:MAG: hypothetical protein DMG88_10055 [Acidobacteriota bacterium]
MSCKNSPAAATIGIVQNASSSFYTMAENPFHAGSMVIATLGNPREKFWGAILGLTPEGLSLCGIELASFDDLVSMVKEGEPFSPAVVFFPMHRIERIDLDLADGNLPSLTERFAAKTNLDAVAVLTRPAAVHARSRPQP